MSRPLPIAGARLPKPGGVLSYGYQRTPTHRHQGLDFPAPLGTPVYASEGGTVEHAHRSFTPGFSGYGRVVVVRHDDGTRALYAHLEDVHAQQGQRVATGTALGTVGTTAFRRDAPTARFAKSGPHLHFEVSPGAYPRASEAPRIDPAAWLSAEPSGTPVPPSSSSGPGIGGLVALLAFVWGLYG